MLNVRVEQVENGNRGSIGASVAVVKRTVQNWVLRRQKNGCSSALWFSSIFVFSVGMMVPASKGGGVFEEYLRGWMCG